MHAYGRAEARSGALDARSFVCHSCGAAPCNPIRSAALRSNDDVFAKVHESGVVDAAMDGSSAAVLCYGQTGSGKT